jgi:amidohydrolase
MHACGHDGHTAIGLTVAKILAKHHKDIAGTVKLVFQPAEEGLGGAKLMVKEGVLANPKPEISLSLHLWNEQPVGWVCATQGPAMAASETFYLRITGKGGHGAHPHGSIDPVLAGSQIVTALQSIVSRNVDPLKAAVVSVTTFNAGETFNVIPQEAVLSGTIRSFDPEVREIVLQRFREIVSNVAQANMCQVDIEIESITPAVVNNPTITRKFQQMVKGEYPDLTLVTNYQTMGSEDMAYMMDDIPGCYFFVGSNNSEQGLDAKHHHPKFDFDERALVISSVLMSNAIMSMLE